MLQGMYIHSPVTHILLHIARAQSHLHTSHACHTHAWLQRKSCQKGVVAHVSYLSILPSLSPVSPVSAVPVQTLRHPLSVHNLAVAVPRSAGHAPLRTCIEEFGYLAKSDANTGYEPKKFDNITSVDNDTMLIDDPDLDAISDFSKTTHENTGLFGVLTMFESSVLHVSHDDFALQVVSKEGVHRETDC